MKREDIVPKSPLNWKHGYAIACGETGKPVAHIIHSFGRVDHLDREGGRRRRYILCYHPEEAERQKKHREQKIRFLEEGLKRHPARQANAQWVIELPASSRYKRYICL